MTPDLTLARLLRDRRLALGLSLDDVQRETRVPRGALAALEAGRIEDLPASPVTKGFALAYAGAVDLDPAHVHDRWPSKPASIRARARPVRPSAWRWVVLLALLLLPLVLLGWWWARAVDDQLGETGQATRVGPMRLRSPGAVAPATLPG
ncbi:MAG: helix-turn-helix domain-containing protein [Sandaracinaceae bacterium]